MKRIVKILVMFFMVFGLSLQLFGFSKMSEHPTLLQSGPSKMWCHVCGMNLKMFYKTSHAVVLKDGEKRQYCSIRCLVVDWPKIKDRVKEVLVVDAKSQKFIPAKKAYYVVGSRVKGTMSRVSKIAFAKKEDALDFVKKYGGEIVGFERAFEMAKKSLKEDMALMKRKKEMMAYPKGKMLYERECKKDIDKKDFKSIGELKTYLVKSKVCGNLQGKPLQMLALYIWEAKDKADSSHIKIKPPKDAKCPVCGMFVYKYPRWAAEIVLSSGKLLYFDGAKDMFKFLLNPSKYGYENIEIKKILVNDYYRQTAIDAKSAYFVLGSDVLGPMGDELIPFKTKEEAETFLKDHGGDKILKFNQINKEVMKNLE